MNLKKGDCIKLTNIYAGPRGSFPAGRVLTAGVELPVADCQGLLDGQYASLVPPGPPAPTGKKAAKKKAAKKTTSETSSTRKGLLGKIAGRSSNRD